MQRQPYRSLNTSELQSLLSDVVRERLGEDAQRIIGVLNAQGPSSLLTVAKALPDRNESQIRAAAGLALKHDFISYDDESDTFSVNFGLGILPLLFPLVIQYVAEHFPERAQELVLVLLEHHDLPQEALISIACKGYPTGMGSAFTAAFDELRKEGIIGSVGGSTRSNGNDSSDAIGARTDRKRTADADPLISYQLQWHTIVSRLRRIRVKSFVQFKYGAAAAKVINAFLGTETTSTSPAKFDRDGFPRLQYSVAPVSNGIAMKSCAPLQPSAFLAAVEQLHTDCFLSPYSSTSNEGQYTINFAGAIASMRKAVLESMIASRHGVVGLRIMKLLEENEAMEDRFIAEEALVTHSDARLTLTAMLRDGMVRMLELPKGSINERLPKNSIFLWTLNREMLLESAQMQSVKALANARTCLLKESDMFRQTMPPAYFADPTTILSTAEAETATKFELSKAALQQSIVALAERVLLLHYF